MSSGVRPTRRIERRTVMVVIASLGLLTAPVGPLKGMAAQDQQCRLLLPLVEVPLNLKLKAFGLSLVFLFLFLLQMTNCASIFSTFFSFLLLQSTLATENVWFCAQTSFDLNNSSTKYFENSLKSTHFSHRLI